MNSTECANRKIEEATEANINRHRHDTPAQLTQRIRELEAEWDIERTLEANAATAVLVGVGLGVLVDRRFFALPGIVGGFLLQHALQGWCPPLPIFRSLGVRTQSEIDREIFALKAIRGDFKRVDATKSAGAAMDAVVR
jgi:F0F1-type ATP synthase assembly protein I